MTDRNKSLDLSDMPPLKGEGEEEVKKEKD